MSANPLWLTLLSPALSFLALAVNVWITFRNWQRRPAAHWTCIPIHGKEGRADFNRFLKDANDDLEKSDGIGHMFALTNNGEMQAAGVKLFALGCSVQAIQYLDTPHGQAKDIGAEFAFVEPRGTVYALLDDPESKLFLDGVTPAKSGWFRVYWMDSPTRKPQYLKQDFRWDAVDGQRLVDQLVPLDKPTRVSKKEYDAGTPIVDNLEIHGFVQSTRRERVARFLLRR